MRVLLFPFLPCRFRERYFFKPAFKILSLYTHQSSFIRIPKGFALFVIKNKGVFIGPSRRCQSQCFSIYGTAVHSRKFYQRSVGCSNGFFTDYGIGDLMVLEFFYRIGLRIISVSYTDDSGIFKSITHSIFEV